MKPTKILALFASLAFASSALAQTTVIGGAIQNGDLELGVVAPFAGNAGTISALQNHTVAGANSVEVDMTANNGNAQWKGISSNPGGSIPADTDVLTHYVWCYIPAATEFPNGVNGDNVGGLDVNDTNTWARLNINLQWTDDGAPTGYGNFPSTTATPEVDYAQFYPGPTSPIVNGFNWIDLKTAARDTWIQVAKVGVTPPAGATHIRINHNIQTHSNSGAVPKVVGPIGGLVAADGGDDTNEGAGPADLPGPAVAADWNASGYSGVIYLDDFFLSSSVPPPPAPTGTLVCDAYQNGNFEAALLAPWNPGDGAGFIETTIVQEGAQSLGVDMTTNNSGNQWRGFNLGSLQLPAVDGDVIGTAAYIYVPSGNTFGGTAQVNFEVRSDRNMGDNGNMYPAFGVNLTTVPTDVWTLYTTLTPVTDGDQTLTAVNTSGWNIETIAGAQTGYTGNVYFDDVKFMNLGQPVADPEGTIVGPNTQNGTLEGSSLPAPWGGPVLEPWVFSGAGSLSTAQDHTTGSGNSVCVDLTANNSNAQWKGQHQTIPEIDPLALGYDKVDVSAWVYIPAATTFGPTAALNFPIVVKDPNAVDPNASIFLNNGTGLDLTTANRDEWILVESNGIDVSGTNFLAINNWNLETETLVGPAGMLVRADGSDGTAATGSDTGADLVGPAVAADWQASGYDGVFYMDDVSVVAYSSGTNDPISVNSITYDGTDVVINYNTSFNEEGFEGVDIYYSTDLVNWTADVFVSAVGNNLEVTRPSGDAARYYILVEPGQTPNFGNFPAPPITEG